MFTLHNPELRGESLNSILTMTLGKRMLAMIIQVTASLMTMRKRKMITSVIRLDCGIEHSQTGSDR